MLDIVVRDCNPSYMGGIDRKMVIRGWPRAKKVQDPIQKIAKAKK
jgi:hypothetical protein